MKALLREIALTVHPEIVRLRVENAKLRRALDNTSEHSQVGWELANDLNRELQRLRRKAK